MIRKLAALIFLLMSISASAQEDERRLVTMDLVKTGMMLLKTNRPGLYVEAPTVNTAVDLRVRGLILRGEVTQVFRNPESTCAEAVTHGIASKSIHRRCSPISNRRPGSH